VKKLIAKLPREILDIIYAARDIADTQGYKAYLVGGGVRDLILGVKNFDLDIVVEANGITFAEELASVFQSKVIRHRRFGTATITGGKHHKIDVSTARKEYYPEPASLPMVAPGDLKDDLFRRDFTINAFAVSINKKRFGFLIDFFGGIKDLQDRKIRILHDVSFIDDPTRVLRAIRFEQRLNFSLEEKTRGLLCSSVRQGMLNRVEPQRIRDDLILMLKEEDPLKEIHRMKELTGFDFVYPGLKINKKAYEFCGALRKEIAWFTREFSSRRHLDKWLMYLMGLLDGLTVRQSRAVVKRFVFRNGEAKRLLEYKTKSARILHALDHVRLKPSRIFHLLEPLSYEMILALKARALNQHCRDHIIDFLRHYNGFRHAISGSDLVSLGVPPGPHYQKIFQKVRDARIDGIIKTREEEIQLAKTIIKSLRG